MTPEEIYDAAMALSDESKAQLAERLVAYLETNVDPDVARAQMDIVRRRRDEVLAGHVEGLDGEAVMARARRVVGR